MRVAMTTDPPGLPNLAPLAGRGRRAAPGEGAFPLGRSRWDQDYAPNVCDYCELHVEIMEAALLSLAPPHPESSLRSDSDLSPDAAVRFTHRKTRGKRPHP
jgi:hypothetical protein